ncbi:MAG TPA: hypothetical protein VLJ21_01680 [Candidatus Binatia bacterium]|nr:hypothetical protein [Candidatus Binatia bacterium]
MKQVTIKQFEYEERDEESMMRYNRIAHFLGTYGEPIFGRVDPLPFIGDGIISGPSGSSAYRIGNVLVELNYHGMAGVFRLQLAGETPELTKFWKECAPRFSSPSEQKSTQYMVKTAFDIMRYGSVSSLEKILQR